MRTTLSRSRGFEASVATRLPYFQPVKGGTSTDEEGTPTDNAEWFQQSRFARERPSTPAGIGEPSSAESVGVRS